MAEPSRVELLELDIDIRLAELWRETDWVDDWDLEHASAFMRAAYGIGYRDALTEPRPGSLHTDHGYKQITRMGDAQ